MLNQRRNLYWPAHGFLKRADKGGGVLGFIRGDRRSMRSRGSMIVPRIFQSGRRDFRASGLLGIDTMTRRCQSDRN